jgi:hypothetical protein
MAAPLHFPKGHVKVPRTGGATSALVTSSKSGTLPSTRSTSPWQTPPCPATIRLVPRSFGGSPPSTQKTATSSMTSSLQSNRVDSSDRGAIAS